MNQPSRQRPGSNLLRKLLLAMILGISLSGISWLFWTHELKYQLPTAVPSNYQQVQPGSSLAISLPFDMNGEKPVFLHFFNPDCPCSKFNIRHFKELVATYGNALDFAIVAMNPDQRYSVADIQDRFDLKLPVSFDTTLATTCGVYSTPQAVIIEQNKLFFRGNYNKSRYCTDPETNYAQMAIDSLLLHKNNLPFGPLAFKAYGCELPTCNKQ
ncbi:redoxin domain-containing protein [Terrimonas sp. NA20]|uniref:Redoxin domain-containing protein n=1 Tax=Terrimonas ginsenosidimutans TaxID=2908004 RepID=A0ABS9KMI5_9BACT|nr:redoxin domain-containing protein [Terrimonas ginsenosidimutans]MCG2613537.1 redoxin domain-containing protein [Terrimonas ginsenosidimutans]